MTVTDANLVLGRLDSRRALHGEICLDIALAPDAIDRLAAQVGLDRPRPWDHFYRRRADDREHQEDLDHAWTRPARL